MGNFLTDLAYSAIGYSPDSGFDTDKLYSTLGFGASALGLLDGGSGGISQPGYQGTIPKYDAVRERVPGTYDPNRRPGSSGRRYFTDTQYIAEDDDIAAAEERMASQAAELSEANIRNPARRRS